MRLGAGKFLAKIAVELEQALAQRAESGAPGRSKPRVLARGEGWIVSDVICTSGPRDSSFEERHSLVSIAVVAAGTFQYRCGAGRELMTPGSFLLGNPGDYFECGHEHAAGDRCVSFQYTPDYFEDLPAFRVPRLPQRSLSPLVARACAGLAEPVTTPWEELGAVLAARVVDLVAGVSPSVDNPPGVIARVTKAVRMIERNPSTALDLVRLAREARLREATLRLLDPKPARAKILDIARMSTERDKLLSDLGKIVSESGFYKRFPM
jgi:hypothetical protein